jgi:hypothetical protein
MLRALVSTEGWVKVKKVKKSFHWGEDSQACCLGLPWSASVPSSPVSFRTCWKQEFLYNEACRTVTAKAALGQALRSFPVFTPLYLSGSLWG